MKRGSDSGSECEWDRNGVSGEWGSHSGGDWGASVSPLPRARSRKEQEDRTKQRDGGASPQRQQGGFEVRSMEAVFPLALLRAPEFDEANFHAEIVAAPRRGGGAHMIVTNTGNVAGSAHVIYPESCERVPGKFGAENVRLVFPQGFRCDGTVEVTLIFRAHPREIRIMEGSVVALPCSQEEAVKASDQERSERDFYHADAKYCGRDRVCVSVVESGDRTIRFWGRPVMDWQMLSSREHPIEVPFEVVAAASKH